MKHYLKLIIGILALGYLLYAFQKDSKQKPEKVKAAVASQFGAHQITCDLAFNYMA